MTDSLYVVHESAFVSLAVAVNTSAQDFGLVNGTCSSTPFAVTVVRWGFITIGISLNSIEIAIFMSATLRNRSSLFLAAIALLNIILLTLETFNSILNTYYKEVAQSVLQVTIHLNMVPYAIATGLLLLLSWERYQAVCRPMKLLKQAAKSARFRPGVAMIVCWIVFYVALRIAFALVHTLSLNKKALLISMVVCVAIPPIFLAYTSSKLLSRLRQRRGEGGCAKTSIERPCALRKHGEQRSDSATNVVLGLTGLTLVTALLPRLAIQIASVVLVYHGCLSGYSTCVLIARNIELIGFLSLDSVLYFMYHPGYRRRALALFCKGKQQLDYNALPLNEVLSMRRKLTVNV